MRGPSNRKALASAGLFTFIKLSTQPDNSQIAFRSIDMSRPIYDLLTKGQKVVVNGRRGSYQVAKALKQTVLQALTVETNAPCALVTYHPFAVITDDRLEEYLE